MSEQKQFTIISQYIKDLSFESPSAMEFFDNNIKPNIKIDFNVNVRDVKENQHEVSLTAKVSAVSEDSTKKYYVVEAVYCGLIGTVNFSKAELHPLLLIDAPRILFPYLRHVISDTISMSGFSPILLDPIDFMSLYMAQHENKNNSELNGEIPDASKSN